MADRTLLIPGTQATSLVDQDGTVVYNAVRVSLGLQKDELGGRPPREWQRLLSLESRPDAWRPARTSLEPGTDVLPGAVVGTPYDRMLSFAEPWPYDWRMDIRYNAQLLLEHMRAHKPPNGRFNLLGHSQGGLVIVLASKLTFDVNEFSRLVARVVLVGSPLAGTMRAAEALLWGSEGLGPAHVKAARAMALTWPSLYQMLPTWKAVLDPDGAPHPEERQLLQPGGWPAGPGDGVEEEHLLRARETARLLQGPLARFGAGTMSMSLLGKRQMTPVWITREGDRLPADRRATKKQQGDGLVPYRKTLQWGGTAYGDTVVALTGKPDAHAFLCNDPDVLDLTRRFLAAEAPPAPTPPPARAPESSFLVGPGVGGGPLTPAGGAGTAEAAPGVAESDPVGVLVGGGA